jgi:hypothetical protein
MLGIESMASLMFARQVLYLLCYISNPAVLFFFRKKSSISIIDRHISRTHLIANSSFFPVTYQVAFGVPSELCMGVPAFQPAQLAVQNSFCSLAWPGFLCLHPSLSSLGRLLLALLPCLLTAKDQCDLCVWVWGSLGAL